MKKILAVVAQVVLFFLLFAVFSFVQPFHVHWWVSHPSPTVMRFFVADGFLLATAVLLVLLLLEAAARRLRGGMGLTLLSWVLAMAAGFALKLGFVTRDLLG